MDTLVSGVVIRQHSEGVAIWVANKARDCKSHKNLISTKKRNPVLNFSLLYCKHVNLYAFSDFMMSWPVPGLSAKEELRACNPLSSGKWATPALQFTILITTMKMHSFYLLTFLLLAQLDFAIRSVYAINPRLLQRSGVGSIGRNIPTGPSNHLSMAATRRHVKRDEILSIDSDLNLTTSSISDILGTPNGDSVVPGLDDPKFVVAQ